MPPSARSAASKAPAGNAAGDARVVLLTGSEAGPKIAEAQRLQRDAADETFADFDAETLDGATTTADRILSGVATVPLGDGRRVVLVRDTQQMEADEQKRLAAGLARIPSSGLLLLHTGTPIVEEGKTRRQSVVTTELINAVKKVGRIADFAPPKTDDLRDWVVRAARERGKALAPDAVALFAQLPGDDLNRIGSELDKVITYAGDAPTVTGADVEAVLSRNPDDVIFKLCDAVGMRRTPEALGYVSTLFRGGGRAEAVAPRALVLLARQIRLLAQFRYLGERKMAGRGAGPVSAEVMALLPADGAAGMLTNPRLAWMADKYVTQARNFKGSELAERLERLLAADLALKGVEPGGDSPQAVLQRLVVELC